MTQRGRPRKNGQKAPRSLLRSFVGLRAFDSARSAGEKYEAALDAGVEAVRTERPAYPVSRTEMKRILAEFRSDFLETTFFIEESDDTTTPNGTKFQKAWDIRVGEMPKYTRHNVNRKRQRRSSSNKMLPGGPHS
jgi:hypothetical protein